jgi:hypothetical protein
MPYTTEQIEIPLSKTKLILMLVGSIAFVLLGLWLISEADNLSGRMTKNPTYTRRIGAAGVLFFGVCAVYIGRKIPDNKPGLIIDEFGLTDNSSGISAGKIMWNDIKYIKVIEIHQQKLIMFHVNNPQDYIDKQTSGLRRKMMQLNYNMYGTPLSIASNSLKIKFDDLLNILNDQLKANQQ